MKILYTGPLGKWTTTEARRKAFIELGHEIFLVDSSPLHAATNLLGKIQGRLLTGPTVKWYNNQLLGKARETLPDMIWVDKGVCVWPRTLETMKKETGASLVHYNSDFIQYQKWEYRHYFRSIGLYDVHITTNAIDIPVLENMGARKVVRAEFGYDPEYNRPTELSDEDKLTYGHDMVFIGHWEPATEELLVACARKGLSVNLWGYGWKHARNKHLLNNNRRIEPLYGEAYIKTLAAAKICLCFLSKWNRNQSAGRTFEIPAIGGFLLAERTPDHFSYFDEGKEAEFFAGPAELIEKAQYYLKHEERRLAIARASHDRCLRSAYTHKDRVRQILEMCNLA